MFPHIDVFILHKFSNKISPILNKITFNEAFNKYNNGYKIDPRNLEVILSKQPPKTAQLVHRLKEMGFSPATISEWLDIHPATISYHLSHPLKKEYRNKYLQEHYNYWLSVCADIARNETWSD